MRIMTCSVVAILLVATGCSRTESAADRQRADDGAPVVAGSVARVEPFYRVGDPREPTPPTGASKVASEHDEHATTEATNPPGAGADPTRGPDPVAALRAIHDQLDRVAAASARGDTATVVWRDRIVPGSLLTEQPAPSLVPASPRRYRLQSDDGVRANVFVASPSGRTLVTLVRWNGAWRLGAIIALVERPPLVVIATDR